HKKVGEMVLRNETIADLETDKVMLEVPSPTDGILKEILKPQGSIVKATEIIALIEAGAVSKKVVEETSQKAAAMTTTPQAKMSAALPVSQTKADTAVPSSLSPSVRRVVAEHDIDVSQITGTGKGGRITKENALTAMHIPLQTGTRSEERVPMTRIRARIAERLLAVKQNTAMLTTFNEINMAPVMAIRQRYRDLFEKKHRVRLGFMSFFVHACIEALKRSPLINASIDGNDIIYHGYFDVGVAVSTERGLVVPILRDAEKLSMAGIESAIVGFAEKARSGKLTMADLEGGTFTITNGGVFGSLLSTPILNAPQSSILGMHKIQERPVVENGQIVIRPMMYVALSYDHRLVDGKEAVTFLVAVKEMLEDPVRFALEV
ncbi:MAG: dihydrolipoamide succinyltransferase, E2 subunit, partial [uncultured bacterium]